MRSRPFMPVALIAVPLCLWLAGPRSARADDLKVTAAISDASPEVGGEVDYTITVNGATDASVPKSITVKGLAIIYDGPSTQTNIRFGAGTNNRQTQTSVICTYSVVPERTGDFTIPAQPVEIDGRSFTTQAVTFKVGNASVSQSGSNGKFYYAEIILSQATAYAGEALPIEIRLYVDTHARARLDEMPEITANGCTVEKTTTPIQSQVTRNGRDYIMVSYKTTVTPAKAGELKIGPVKVAAEAQVPLHRKDATAGGPFDDPFFRNQMSNDAFQSLSPIQHVQITGDAVPLTALPPRGKPGAPVTSM